MRVGADSVVAETMPEAHDFRLGEQALVGIQLQSGTGKGAQYQIDVEQVIFHSGRRDEDIIEETKDVFRGKATEDQGHERLHRG